jgi:hypothetical protein
MKTVLAVLLSLLAIPVSLLAFLHFSENTKVHFATLDEARREGVSGHGLLIPEGLLPGSATDVTLQVNADTNERWVTYSWVGSQTLQLPECIPDATLDVDAVRGPWWWSRAATEIAKNAEKYRCIDRGELAGFWLSHDCVLILGQSKGAWSCDSGRQMPK